MDVVELYGNPKFWMVVIILATFIGVPAIADFAAGRVVDIAMAPVFWVIGIATVISWIAAHLPDPINSFIILGVLFLAGTKPGHAILSMLGELTFRK